MVGNLLQMFHLIQTLNMTNIKTSKLRRDRLGKKH